jgi:hypothetical protein
MTLLAQDLISTAYSNVPEFTVGEISGILKRTIEDKFSFVRVNFRIKNSTKWPCLFFIKG